MTDDASRGSEPGTPPALDGGPGAVAAEVPAEAGGASGTGSPGRRRRGVALRLVSIVLLLFVVPWWTLFSSGAGWPLPVDLAGAVLFAAAVPGLPLLMVRGHGRRQSDRAARVGDTALGVVWVLFTWSVLSLLLRLALFVSGVDDPARSRIVAACVVAVAAFLLARGHHEAMRVPRVKRLDVTVARLGRGLDGTRIVVLADTHYGPIDRAGWSARLAAAVNSLDADVICHAGDIADGSPERRREQAAPLGTMGARLAKVYVTGNHEYSGGAQGWLDLMDDLGWEPLHNRHVVVERGGSRLVLAGVDDVTAASSGQAGHRADLAGALTGADPDLPVLLVAHQPKFVARAAEAGVDLQVSGHTHGGQIWPFHYLVRTDQPVVHGLSRHGARTQLYTSRGAGFWGPPFRVFAPSEITVLTLRSA